jgi:hypothetical protein
MLGVTCSEELHVMSRATEEFVLRVLAYFPGQWDIRSDDGAMTGFVRWKVEAGGMALAGRGRLRNGRMFAMAGWDPAKKEWIHTFIEENGSFGQIVVTQFKNNMYRGTLYYVEGNGEGGTSEWNSRIIDKDHFVVTEFLKGDKVVLNFHRQ